MVGPITIFDKSALQALNVDEAMWFAVFYMANITPLFFVETLADLEKADPRWRPAEEAVSEIAQKTPVIGAQPNLHHATLCQGELLGHPISMTRCPLISGGREVETPDGRGMVFEHPPEVEALQRWQSGEFLEVERRFARGWRQGLSGLDLGAIYDKYRDPRGGRVRDLPAARARAEYLVNDAGNRFSTLKLAMETVRLPHSMRSGVVARWKTSGGQPLHEFAPYTAHVMTVDMFFNVAIGSDLIGRQRPSNKIDVAYLYYLPFAMIFVSNDRLHERCAPCFLQEDQLFLSGRDLKQDLRQLDDHFSALPAEVRERGVLSFAQNPPPEGDYLTTRLWDRFLPRWRRNLTAPKLSPEALEKVRQLAKQMNAAKPVAGPPTVDTDSAKFVRMRKVIPKTIGKWRMVPPEAS